MKIGDEILVHGFIDEIRKDTVIVRNDGGYFGTTEDEVYSLVRCGECKYWKRYDTTLFKEPAFRPCLRSGGMDSFTTWYDYCSLGEGSED